MRSAKVINDRLTMLLGAAADYRMRNFVSLDESTPYSFYSSRLFVAFGVGSSQGDVVMGLAPWEARPGDSIVQFWKSDTALVIRDGGKDGEQKQVGRAGVVRDSGAMDWDVPKDKQLFESSESGLGLFASVDMITRLSFDTVCLPGTRGLRFDESLWDQTRQMWASHDFELHEIGVSTDGSRYDSMWDHDLIEHIDETAVSDLEAACIATPCLQYTSENVQNFAFRISHSPAS